MQLSSPEALEVRANFVNFAVRGEVLNREQAREELGRLMPTPVRTTGRDYYLRLSRVGASFTLTRLQRAQVFMIFENAVNHATFFRGN